MQKYKNVVFPASLPRAFYDAGSVFSYGTGSPLVVAITGVGRPLGQPGEIMLCAEV